LPLHTEFSSVINHRLNKICRPWLAILNICTTYRPSIHTPDTKMPFC
jgi:hypothetical protein